MRNYIEKGRYTKFVFPMLIFACLGVSYWHALNKLLWRWSSGDNNYSYLIIPLFLYLLWDKKDQFRFHEFSWNPWGLVATILAVGLMVIGELGSVETILYTGIWAVIVGIFITFYGRRTRLLVFPLFMLLFIVPMPSFINRILTFKLKMAASTLSVGMLRTLGYSVLQEGNIIDIGITQLQVVDACSGLRYLVPMIVMTLFIGYLFIKGWWRKSVLLLLVLPLSISINALRIFITGWLMLKGYPNLAENFFHNFSGWLVFMVAGGLLVIAAFMLRKIGSPLMEKPEVDTGGRSMSYMIPSTLTVIFCLIFLSSGWAMKKIPAARNLPQRMSFKSFPMEIGLWQGRKGYLSKEILKELWADDYVSATFYRQEYPNTIHLLIPFYEYQGTRHTAHAPQSCLLGGGWDLLKTRDHEVKMNPGNDIKIKTMHLKKGDVRLLGSYFFMMRGRVITSPWMNKFYLMWDSLTKQRTDGALVRVEMTIAPNQTIEEAYALLDEFIAMLWMEIPKYVPL
ncbi:MAG: VPLPA-CTERM-specific exosortase XrtD [Promethearchaeota archaeon]|jgi:exosortase D (VPLPA-CTERM-specific)